MDISETLKSILTNGISYIEGRVYPLTMPQDTKHDCLVYTIFGDDENSGYCGIKVSSDYTIQIDVFSLTYGGSIELKSDVISTLRASDLKISNVRSYSTYENYTLKYRQIISFRIVASKI